VKPCRLVNDLVRSVLRVGMPRTPRLNAPGGTMHLVARWGTQRAVGSPTFVAPYVPPAGRPKNWNHALAASPG